MDADSAARPLDQAGERALLRLARDAIARALRMGGPEAREAALPDGPVFREPGAAFVTLTKKGGLRGCIGSLAAVESLAESVRRNAVNAALHDPRFAPLTPEELAEVRIEISVLGEPEPLPYTDAADLTARLAPGKDGLILEGPRGHRATFLPQVWRQLPNPADFLSALCRKAGLSDGAWKTEPLRYRRYGVHSFEEEG